MTSIQNAQAPGTVPLNPSIQNQQVAPTPKPGTTQPISTNTTPVNQPNSPTDLYSSLLSSFDPGSNSVMNLFQGVLGDNSTTSTNTANTPNSGLDLTSWLTTLDPSLGSLMKSLGLTTSTNSFDFSSFFGSNFGTSGATNTSSLPLPLNPDPQVDPRINYALDLLGKAPGKYTSGNNTIQIADTNGISTATVLDTTSGKTTATYSWDGKSTLQIQDESGKVDVTFGPDAIGVFNKSTNSGYFLIPNGKGYTQQSSAPSNPTNSNPTNPVNPVNPNPINPNPTDPVNPNPIGPTNSLSAQFPPITTVGADAQSQQYIGMYNEAVGYLKFPPGQSTDQNGNAVNVALNPDGSEDITVRSPIDPNQQAIPSAAQAPSSGRTFPPGVSRYNFKPDGTLTVSREIYSGAYMPPTTTSFSREDSGHTLTVMTMINYGENAQAKVVHINLDNGQSTSSAGPTIPPGTVTIQPFPLPTTTTPTTPITPPVVTPTTPVITPPTATTNSTDPSPGWVIDRSNPQATEDAYNKIVQYLQATPGGAIVNNSLGVLLDSNGNKTLLTPSHRQFILWSGSNGGDGPIVTVNDPSHGESFHLQKLNNGSFKISQYNMGMNGGSSSYVGTTTLNADGSVS